MHDGSTVILKKLEKDYDPTDRWQALRMMEEAQRNDWMVTGLIYLETGRPALTDLYNLPETPLNRLTDPDLRPARETLDKLNAEMG
jgi:2-oxoglutarate ferredoxin oxidoreductase subunit beta